MTNEQLDEIEKLAEAATPGPWIWRGPDEPADLWTADGKDPVACIQTTNTDIKFIRAMREHALPLVKALREARDDLRQSEERRDDLSMLICTPERQLGDEIINLRRELAESSRRLATALRECAFANERLRRLKAETGWGKRECGCQCQWEAGDSACPMHGEEAT